MYSLESHQRCVSNELTYYHLIEDQKDTPKYLLIAHLTCAKIIPKWLELPMSKTNFHGANVARAFEVRLFFIFQRGEVVDDVNDGTSVDTGTTFGNGDQSTIEESIGKSVDEVDNKVKQ